MPRSGRDVFINRFPCNEGEANRNWGMLAKKLPELQAQIDNLQTIINQGGTSTTVINEGDTGSTVTEGDIVILQNQINDLQAQINVINLFLAQFITSQWVLFYLDGPLTKGGGEWSATATVADRGPGDVPAGPNITVKDSMSKFRWKALEGAYGYASRANDGDWLITNVQTIATRLRIRALEDFTTADEKFDAEVFNDAAPGPGAADSLLLPPAVFTCYNHPNSGGFMMEGDTNDIGSAWLNEPDELDENGITYSLIQMECPGTMSSGSKEATSDSGATLTNDAGTTLEVD